MIKLRTFATGSLFRRRPGTSSLEALLWTLQPIQLRSMDGQRKAACLQLGEELVAGSIKEFDILNVTLSQAFLQFRKKKFLFVRLEAKVA